MRKIINAGINFILKPFDLALQKSSLKWERDALAALYESRTRWIPKTSEHPAECIIFSKDRALQLHALLASYYEKVDFPVPLHVLYHTSNPTHQKAYEEVMTLFADYSTSFIKQKSDNSFQEDLIEILSSLQADKVLFLVDDVIFIEDVDMRDFVKFDTDKFVPSLRMGLNIKHFYHLNKTQVLPEYVHNISEGKDKIIWEWNQGVYDWRYPLSVDGHLFSTQEMTAMVRLISFQAPNSFEDKLQQFLNIYLYRFGVSYCKSKIVNIPCNKVQEENDNICGNIDQDFLLKQWGKGVQMDYKKLYGFINESVHQEIAFDLITRRAD